MNTKQVISSVLATLLCALAFSGCGNKNADITIAAWPNAETNQAKYEVYQKYLEQFKASHSDISVETDEWQFDLKTYLVRAAGKDLPTVFRTAPTELDTLVKSGYIKDITNILEKRGYLNNYDSMYDFTYMKDGKAYAIVDPSTIYTMGIVCNKDVFKKAGLVNGEGMPIFPQTWDELAKTAATIKEKTGLPGFYLPTKSRHGGWIFMNIAYSYGVEFVKQDNDGKWKATFDTQECVDALQYIKDLKWKYNAIQDNTLVSLTDEKQAIGIGEAGMGIIHSKSILDMPKKFGTSPKALAMCRIPAGPKGRFAVSSADIYVISGESTDAQAEAVFDWLDLIGLGPDVDGDKIAAWEATYKANADENMIVGIKPNMIWKEGERKTAQLEAMAKYANVDPVMFADYVEADDVNLRSDPEKLAQELYDILDAAIQKVLTDKDADVAAIIKDAAFNYQTNFLDKE